MAIPRVNLPGGEVSQEVELFFLTFCTLLSILLVSYRSNKVFLPFLPDQPLFILLGIFFSFSALLFTGVLSLPFLPDSQHLFNGLFVNFSRYFFEFCLPPIIFASSYGLKGKAFFKNLTGIILFAVFGTIISTFFIGFGVYWILKTLKWTEAQRVVRFATGESTDLGGMSQDDDDDDDGKTEYGLSLSDSLILGALLSAVDPVATLSVLPIREERETEADECRRVEKMTRIDGEQVRSLKGMKRGEAEMKQQGWRLKVNNQIHALIFGENVLNAAVAVVLFNRLADLHLELKQRADEQGLDFNEVDITGRDVVNVLAHFFLVFLGSTFLGAAVGLLASYSLKMLNYSNCEQVTATGASTDASAASVELGKMSAGREQAVLLLFAYTSYMLGGLLQLSPVMCLFMTGVTMSHYAFYNISVLSQISTASSFAAISNIAETLAFIFLGISFSSLTMILSDNDDSSQSVNVHFHENVVENIELILLVIILCNVSRLIDIVLLSNVVNAVNYLLFVVYPMTVGAALEQKEKFYRKYRRRYIDFSSQLFLSWAGIRGAVSFALALHVPILREKGIVITVAMSVILFSYIVNGGTVQLLYRRLGLHEDEEEVGVKQDRKDANKSNIESGAQLSPNGSGGEAHSNPFAVNGDDLTTPLIPSVHHTSSEEPSAVEYGSIRHEIGETSFQTELLHESSSPRTRAIFRDMLGNVSKESMLLETDSHFEQTQRRESGEERSFLNSKWSFKRIDDLYLKPIFGGKPRRRKKKKRVHDSHRPR